MPATRTDTVMATIRQRIGARSLASGQKLPSIRRMAKTLGLSPSTVAIAYDRLVAEGTIVSRPGSGFFVAPLAAPFSPALTAPQRERAVDPFWVSRQSLEAGPADLKPGCGWLPPDWLPEAALRRALRSLSRAPAETLVDYAPPLGLLPLRQTISRRLAEKHITAAPDQIVLTESGTQAIDLVCRLLLEPGDTVLVDDPCYFNFTALLRAHRARLVGVPYTATGPDLAALAGILKEHRPRLYITNSAIHNPTGVTLAPTTAHRLLKLAAEFGLTIVEDEIFADFELGAAPRLAAYDGLDRVVTIGSFSKSLSASVRTGFIACRPDWIEDLLDLKIATSFGGGQFNARIVQTVLGDGEYRKHLEALRRRLSLAMAETISRLERLGVVPWHRPQSGFLLWCRMPDGLDAAALARHALDHNLVLAPGNVFSVGQTATSFMRFNTAQCADRRVFPALEAALNEVRKSDILGPRPAPAIEPHATS